MWQRKKLSDGSSVGSPGPLPSNLVGLSSDVLANLSNSLDPQACLELGYLDTGFVFVADPPPPSPRTISPLEFLQRIPAAKRAAIMQAAAAPDYQLQVLLQMVNAALNGVNLDDPDTVNGLTYAQSLNLLTAGDVATIRA